MNGGWGSWSGWSGCSVTCGAGTTNRTRQCNNPPPQNDGHDCSGSSSESSSCNNVSCSGKLK